MAVVIDEVSAELNEPTRETAAPTPAAAPPAADVAEQIELALRLRAEREARVGCD